MGYLKLINNISISVSLYCLVLFYMATEERLAPFSPFYKFITVKAILFFSFWQSCAFLMLVYFNVLTHTSGNVILNLITCGEMVLCAVAQTYSFTYKDFLTQADLSGRDTPHRVKNKKNHNLCDTLSQVLFYSTRDVLDDAHSTFLK